jgi:transposase
MRKTYEILRLLWFCNQSMRAVARSCQVARSTVKEYQIRARAAGLECWGDVESLDPVALEGLLFPVASTHGTPRPVPVWAEVHEEMQRKGVTLQLLWEEYKVRHPRDGLQYSRFTDLYRAYRGRLDVSLRQVHKAGEKLFVDYCGQTVPVRDPQTGEVRQAEVFVAVLGASNFTYAEATWSQQLADWVGAHERAFAALGGTTEVVVPDNLRSAVHKACRYEPALNPTYQEMAEHYGVAVVPARVRKPKDKAKAEAGVLLVERWILACLRHREFFSLEELNAAIRALNERLNDRPFRKMTGSRRSRFEALDRPALRPLPGERFEIAEWRAERVRRDYHVELDEHFYSVPHELVDREIDIRWTATTVECLHRGQRVACHVRNREAGGMTTVPEHMPSAHREYLAWTPQRLLDWAAEIGTRTAEMAAVLLVAKKHPTQGLHAALGLRSLARDYGEERLEPACNRALLIGALALNSVRSILKNGLDRRPLPASMPAAPPADTHENVRGRGYYAPTPAEATTGRGASC